MNTLSQIEKILMPNGKKIDFINLKGKPFAECKIIYHINDCYSIKQLSEFRCKNQLLFQKFNSKTQQLNLSLVDSIFPNILSDVALDVFLNKVSTFNEYIRAEKTILVISPERDKEYFKYKFFTFINYLLYRDIASNKIYKGKIHDIRNYCLKNKGGEIEFYSIYDQNELQLMLLDKMKLQIDLKSSSIGKEEVTLYLKIFVE